jgi:hypothetical protein
MLLELKVSVELETKMKKKVEIIKEMTSRDD